MALPHPVAMLPDPPHDDRTITNADIREINATLHAVGSDLMNTSSVDLESGKPTCQFGKALAVAKGLGIRLTDRTAGHGPMTDAAAVPSADTLPGPGDAYPDLPDLGDEA